MILLAVVLTSSGVLVDMPHHVSLGQGAVEAGQDATGCTSLGVCASSSALLLVTEALGQ